MGRWTMSGWNRPTKSRSFSGTGGAGAIPERIKAAVARPAKKKPRIAHTEREGVVMKMRKLFAGDMAALSRG